MKKTPPRTGNSILYWLLALIVAIACTRCTKPEGLWIDVYYEEITDWYWEIPKNSRPDTNFIERHQIRRFNENRPQYTFGFDTASDQWAHLCSIHPQLLQHMYYTRNGKKIQPSRYPKN